MIVLISIIITLTVIWRLLAPDTLLTFGAVSINIKVVFKSIGWAIRNFINSLRLISYLTGFQKKIAKDIPYTMNSSKEATLVANACKYMQWSRIKRNKGKLVVLIPCSRHFEIQEYIFNLINGNLQSWLNEKYPEQHWSQIELNRSKYSLIHYFQIKEK